MRPVRLHDTRTGEPVELEAREGRRVGIYACGPTVYSRVHVGNAGPYVVFLLLARFLRHEGYEPVLVANVTDINDKIYDAARVAGRPSDELAREMTAHYVADTDRLGLGRPDHEPLATEMVAEIEALIADLLERGHAYEADGDVYFRVRSLPEYGELSHRDVDEMDQGEGVEGADRKEDRSTSRCGRRRSPSRTPRGTRRGAAAAPAGTSSARPWPRRCSGSSSRSTAAGSTSSSPTTRTRRRRRSPPAGGRSPGSGCTTAWSSWAGDGAEKMSKSLGNIRGLAEVLDEVGRDALVMYFCEGHYRQPLAFSRERFEDASRRLERIRDAGRRLVPGDSPPGSWRRTATRSSPRWPTTSTRRGRSRRCPSGFARPTRAPRSGTPTCARCSTCWGS